MENQGLPRVLVFVLVGVLVLFLFGSQMYTVIQPGERGVMYYSLGDGVEPNKTYGEGIQFFLPWNKMIVYNVKKQTLSQKVAGKDINEVQCALDMNVIYHPYPEKIGYLEREIGSSYSSGIIKPKLKDIALSVINKYTYDDIISSKKDVVKDEIQKMMKDSLSDYHIDINEILINDIIISPEIERAIQEKVEAEQLALKQKYVIEKEEQEKVRKRIEAEGIADFQDIVNQTITPELLRWKGVEATEKLASSPNAKVIVIGNGDGDLPIILGGDN